MVDVVVHRKADGVGGVVVGGKAVHQFAHGGGGQLGGRVHQFAALNEQLLEQGLAAGVRPALEGHDVQILTAHVLPVGDLSGVDVPQLLLGQVGHGVVLVHDEHQCVHADGFLLQLDVGGLQLFLDGIRGFVHHQHFGVGVVQTKALPGISGGADRNDALSFFQVHAGGVGQHLRHQGDAGRAAVQGREVLHGQERCGGHLTGSRGSRGLRGGGSRRSRLAAAGAGRQDPGGRAGGKTQQKAAAGNFRVFHQKKPPVMVQ